MKLLLTFIIALLIGLTSGWAIWGLNSHKQSADYHWNKVFEYRNNINNPKNYEKKRSYAVASDVLDVSANLAALVSMGELYRKDVIIPGLPNEREHIISWMEFTNRPGIIDATGPGSYQQGEIPLMFTVWYTKEAEDVLDEYISDLKAKAAELENQDVQ